MLMLQTRHSTPSQPVLRSHFAKLKWPYTDVQKARRKFKEPYTDIQVKPHDLHPLHNIYRYTVGTVARYGVAKPEVLTQDPPKPARGSLSAKALLVHGALRGLLLFLVPKRASLHLAIRSPPD